MLQTVSWPAIAAAIIAAGTGCTDSSTEAEEPDVDDQALVSSPTGVVANCVGVRCTADANVDEQPVVYAAPPATVTSLSSLATAMRLAFTVPSGVSTISIYRMDKTTEGFWRRHTSVPVNPTGSYSYDDAGAILGREYCYSVGTMIAGDTRVTMSNTLCAFHSGGTLPPPPAAPTDFAVSATYERSLRFRFTDASTDETSFIVERNVFGSWVYERTLDAESGTGTAVRFTQGDLDSEQRYCYRIKAVNANGASAPVQACGRTNPLGVVDPVFDGGPDLITIEHPATGSLRVRWLDGNGGNQWVVRTFDGLTSTEIGSATVADHRDPPHTHQTLTLTGLTPGKLYCFSVGRASINRPEKLCEVPFAARTAVEHRDPRPEVTPSIFGLATPRNGRIRISLTQPQPGQIIERINSVDSVRRTLQVDADGGTVINDDTVTPGQTYCYRPWVFNDYGSRYGAIQCVQASTFGPTRPMNLRVSSQDGLDVVLAWDESANATSYDFKWFGEKPYYQDREGQKTVWDTDTSFHGFDGYEYCFSVRGKNEFGTSAWTELCGIETDEAGPISYGTTLQQIPATVTYSHDVSPGDGAAFLTNVNVAGNGFTPYVVRFIASGNCETNNGGIWIEPGASLTGADLDTLYGATQPQAPLTLVGCKMWRGNGESNLDPMPIEVTYRR